MSGPKTSSYYLTPEQRRILREARELEQKTRATYERKEQLRKSIMNMISATDSSIERADLIADESNREISGLDELKKIRETVAESVIVASNVTIQNGLEALQEQETVLKKVYAQLSVKKVIVEKQLASAEQKFHEELKETVVSGFQLSFANIGSDREMKSNPYILKIQTALNEISDLHISDDLKNKWSQIQNKAKEINNADFLKNFYAMTVLPFVKECQQYSELYQQCGDAYEQLLQEYKLLVKEIGIVAEDIPFSVSAIERLQSEIVRLEQIVSEAEEQAYISQCIDEVMLEMGYNLIGSREVTKKSGKRFRNELYLFDEGTAVNVTKSDDGQITMELGGLDNADRIPTTSESHQLCEDMSEFCEDYEEIEKKLAKKGIKTRRISILPPEEQYAQIINVEDYNMKEDVEHFEVTQKRQQRTSNAALHKEV